MPAHRVSLLHGRMVSGDWIRAHNSAAEAARHSNSTTAPSPCKSTTAARTLSGPDFESPGPTTYVHYTTAGNKKSDGTLRFTHPRHRTRQSEAGTAVPSAGRQKAVMIDTPRCGLQTGWDLLRTLRSIWCSVSIRFNAKGAVWMGSIRCRSRAEVWAVIGAVIISGIWIRWPSTRDCTSPSAPGILLCVRPYSLPLATTSSEQAAFGKLWLTGRGAVIQ
ncbi:hypothetical protein CSOJ01_04167 [Colletotrichum sojae]|uniref:Uncharacterized protein n=1 Tax=Colletotrichum sojae TaxID=2175907 RepID=A0A8H6MZT4_9PEZI|nr:hypothetical protein CSOJ01_04167 [Colletotrichum sojae]